MANAINPSRPIYLTLLFVPRLKDTLLLSRRLWEEKKRKRKSVATKLPAPLTQVEFLEVEDEVPLVRRSKHHHESTPLGGSSNPPGSVMNFVLRYDVGVVHIKVPAGKSMVSSGVLPPSSQPPIDLERMPWPFSAD